MNSKNEYLEVIYNQEERPFTEYPNKLSKHLFEIFKLEKNQKIIDIGCGRGEFINGFISCGMEGFAVDQSLIAKSHFPKINLKQCNLDTEKIPFEDSFFDVVFSKSLVEHFIILKKFL